jgi:hypothetical protein
MRGLIGGGEGYQVRVKIRKISSVDVKQWTLGVLPIHCNEEEKIRSCGISVSMLGRLVGQQLEISLEIL